MFNVDEVYRHIANAKLEISFASRVLKGEACGDVNYALTMLEEATRRLEWATNCLLKTES